MNKRYYEHTLPIIRGSLSNTYKTEDIPYDYTYCYATDEQCPKAVHCLCSHAARLNEEQAISLNSRFTGDQKRHPRLN